MPRKLNTPGKWGDPAVPHTHWQFHRVDDLGEDRGDWIDCEMCGHHNVRYAHTMSHPDYGTLHVGSECASNMVQAVMDENDGKSKGRFVANYKRRQKWLDKEKWRWSQRLNLHRKIARRHVVIYDDMQKFRARVQYPGKIIRFTPLHDTWDDAALAAYDMIYASDGERLEPTGLTAADVSAERDAARVAEYKARKAEREARAAAEIAELKARDPKRYVRKMKAQERARISVSTREERKRNILWKLRARREQKAA